MAVRNLLPLEELPAMVDAIPSMNIITKHVMKMAKNILLGVLDSEVAVVVFDFVIPGVVVSSRVPLAKAIGFPDEFDCVIVAPEDVQHPMLAVLKVFPAEIKGLVHARAFGGTRAVISSRSCGSCTQFRAASSSPFILLRRNPAS